MIQKRQKTVQIQLTNVSAQPKGQKKEVAAQDTLKNLDPHIQAKPVSKKSTIRVKSQKRKIFIGLIISLSAVMFGYSLKEITSVPIAILVTQYKITISASSAQSILIGILPLGSVFGAILTKLLMKRFKRLAGIYIFTIVNCVAIVLINITSFATAVVGRFLQGICIGHYSAIAPIYLREIAPKQLRKLLGLFFSLGKIIGVLVVIVIELILEAAKVEYAWRIILSMTGVFSLLQATLIFFFGSDTPTEMIEKGKPEQALKIIKKFYIDEYVDEVYNEYTQEYQAEVGKGKETMSQNLNEEKAKKKTYKYQVNLKNDKPEHRENTLANIFEKPEQDHPEITIKKGEFKSEQAYQYNQSPENKLTEPQQKLATSHQPHVKFSDKKQMAYNLGVHLCVIRHFIGGNAIITQGGLFIKTLDPGLGHYTSLIINVVQFAFIIIGLAYLQKIMGKKPLFLLSIGLLSLLDFALAVGMIYQQQLVCMFVMCLYMAVYGAAFISPIWAYPSEVIPASESLLSNIMHWVALALSTLIPPLVTAGLPHNSSFPVFIFFGLYGVVGFLHVKFKLRESDGLTYKQIISSFK